VARKPSTCIAFEPIAWSPEEIGRNAEAKSKVYEELVKKANISLE
jgi:hypothetical protein